MAARLKLSERADLARRAFLLHEKAVDNFVIARELCVSETTVRNLIGYGRRLAAGQPEKLEWR